FVSGKSSHLIRSSKKYKESRNYFSYHTKFAVPETKVLFYFHLDNSKVKRKRNDTTRAREAFADLYPRKLT
ncbi:hypothetical protein X975_23953, partial [Stegodyphus mimosarum]